MKRRGLLFAMVICLIFTFSCTGKETLPDLSKKYTPQAQPEQTYLLELELLSKGMYCYDLPMFDPDWRARGSELMYSESYINTAKRYSIPFEVYIEGDYAIIYFPDSKSEGPVFFIRIFPAGF